MVKAYYGGVISATAPSVSSSSASGFFNSSQHMQAVNSNLWPITIPITPPFAIYADATYNSQGWVSGSTDYSGTTGTFSFVVASGNIQSSSGGARTNYLPYIITSKIYFEVTITSGGLGDTLFGLTGDANAGGYANVPSVYTYNGGGFGGYTANLNAGLSNGNTLMVAYNASTGKVFYGRNGTWSIDPVSGTGVSIPNVTAGTSAPRFIIMNGASAGSSVAGTIKTKSGTLAYSTPSGYTTIN